MNKPKQYTIEKITDIFQIPRHSFPDFIKDLKEYYNFYFSMADLIKEVGKVDGIEVDVIPTKVIWTDDKRHDIKVTLTNDDNNK